jgi:secondary thiamine-phosphate synthase enzyme
MKTMLITTAKKDQVIDITDTIQEKLEQENIKNGLCHVFVLHTTCCITTADLDPGTDLDLLDGLRNILPELHYRHPHDPSHTPDHILSSIIGPSLFIPVKNGALVLGTWQRIILIELDGPRERQIVYSIIAE